MTRVQADEKLDIDIKRLNNMANNVIIEPESNQVIAKQNWDALKLRKINLCKGEIIREINIENAIDSTVQRILEAAISGEWILICPIQFPQYFMKLSQALNNLNPKQVHDNFRLLIDLQGMTQNEIPDSFIFDMCITFHLDNNNVDDLPGYKDIWSKVLQKEYLEILTDFSADQKVIRNIDMLSEWGPSVESRNQNMTNLFETHNVDPNNYEVFKLYML
jgi:hypothetical protein